MKQRLLLDRVDVHRTDAVIHQCLVDTFLVLAHSAETPLDVRHNTFARAKLTLDNILFQLLVMPRLYV